MKQNDHFTSKDMWVEQFAHHVEKKEKKEPFWGLGLSFFFILLTLTAFLLFKAKQVLGEVLEKCI